MVVEPYYYYYYYVELVPARATTVLHCPLSCMQACISSSCSPLSLIRVSMKVPVGRPIPLLPLSGIHSTRLEAASSGGGGCLAWSNHGWTIKGRTMVYFPWFNHVWTVVVVPWLNQGSPWSYHGTTLVNPGWTTVWWRWYDGSVAELLIAPIPVTLYKSPEVDEWLYKSGSRINNHLFTYAPYWHCPQAWNVICRIPVVDHVVSTTS